MKKLLKALFGKKENTLVKSLEAKLVRLRELYTSMMGKCNHTAKRLYSAYISTVRELRMIKGVK